MKDINLIVYPPGAGGFWLLTVIKNLIENKGWQVRYPGKITYHHFPVTEKFQVTHDINKINENTILFHGTLCFNIFLNQIYKSGQFKYINSAERKIIEMSQTASYILSFSQFRRDIDFDNIFNDPNQLVDQLFMQLDSRKIAHSENRDMILDGIKEYKQTCSDTAAFNNWDDERWLSWCNGVLKHLGRKWHDTGTFEELKENLYPDRDFFYNFTMDKIIEL